MADFGSELLNYGLSELLFDDQIIAVSVKVFDIFFGTLGYAAMVTATQSQF